MTKLLTYLLTKAPFTVTRISTAGCSHRGFIIYTK